MKHSISIITINVPVVYFIWRGTYIKILMGAPSITRAIGRGALKSRLFLGTEE
jgi:hypothetical protein